MPCLTINDSLDVIVQLRYISSRTHVSIQLLSCHTNKPVYLLIVFFTFYFYPYWRMLILDGLDYRCA